jgi:HAD superfamily hydrolase (TIGR01509 family)
MNAWKAAQEILAQQGIVVDDARAKALGDAKQAAFRDMGNPPLARGVEACIHALRKAGLSLVVVTGTSRDNAAFILGPLAAQFDAILAEGDYARAKPHPDPYLAGAKRAGVPPESCVVIENAPLGVKAAVAAGMACIGIPSTMPPDTLLATGAWRIAPSLKDVAAIVLGAGEAFKKP